MTDQPTTTEDEPTEAHAPDAPDSQTQAMAPPEVPAEAGDPAPADPAAPVTRAEHESLMERVKDLEVVARAAGYLARLKSAREQGVELGNVLADQTPDAAPVPAAPAEGHPGGETADDPAVQTVQALHPDQLAAEPAEQDAQQAHPAQTGEDQPAEQDAQQGK